MDDRGLDLLVQEIGKIVLAFEQKYPGKVDVTDLFDHPSVRQLADFMRR